MGQRHGKAVYDSAAKPFLNLSLAAVGTLWETFNDVADGFGINLHEFREICGELGEELQLNRAKLDKVRGECAVSWSTCTSSPVKAAEIQGSREHAAMHLSVV